MRDHIKKQKTKNKTKQQQQQQTNKQNKTKEERNKQILSLFSDILLQNGNERYT